MIHSKRSLEGYVLIDNRNSPGVPDEVVVSQGLKPGAGRGLFESASITCSHCEAIVVLNPDRSRSRGYCPKCDHYVCDACEAIRALSGGECYPYKARVEDAREALLKGEAPGIVYDRVFVKGERPLKVFTLATL
jgi:hypothetical protein